MEILNQPAIVWFIIGLILVLMELATPGLIVVFFGIGAWAVSLLSLILPINLPVQLVVFLMVSICSLLIFRKNLKSKFFEKNENKEDLLDDEFIGKTAIVDAPIKAGMEGKVIFKGAPWQAVSEQDVNKDEKVKIIGKDSIILKVEPVKQVS
jgi:membrane protein implicated in regulation of membrane protease activity